MNINNFKALPDVAPIGLFGRFGCCGVGRLTRRLVGTKRTASFCIFLSCGCAEMVALPDRLKERGYSSISN